MELINKFITIIAIIYCRLINSLRKRKLVVKKHSNICIAYYPEYNKLVRDYYIYCAHQICDYLDISKDYNIIFGHYKWSFPNGNKTFRIDLQYEHTLVIYGGRHSGNALKGVIPISNGGNETYLVRISNYHKLIKADIVIDYSRLNIINISSSGKYNHFSYKLYHFWPLLYDYNNIQSHHNRDLEIITMFGNPDEPYRKRFLNTLHNYGITSLNINNTFDNIDSIYRRTKILINIRQTDSHHTVEELRILPALLCGTIVISETAPLQDLIAYNNFILWANIEDLPELIKNVADNYDSYYDQIFGNDKLSNMIIQLSNENTATAKYINDHIINLLEA